MKPKISVIIPTYNRVDSIYHSIRSVREQNFKNWELIVVDDGSTDNTKQVVASFMTLDDRIRYHQLSENSSSPVTPRNIGVVLAKADLVAFLDSDDTWNQNKLSTQLWYMQHTGSDFSYHDMTIDYGNKIEEWSKTATCHADNVFRFLLRKNFIPTSSVVVKKDLYSKHMMRTGYTISHDWDIWLRIAFENRIAFINEQLAVLNMSDNSVITKIHIRRKECRKIIRSWKQEVNKKYYYKVLCYYYMMEIFDLMPNMIKSFVRRKWYEQEKYK